MEINNELELRNNIKGVIINIITMLNNSGFCNIDHLLTEKIMGELSIKDTLYLLYSRKM